MSKSDFIRIHKTTIDEIIRERGFKGTLNNTDRWEWIINDESLYRWARSEGVRV